jgi:spore germination protein GerM
LIGFLILAVEINVVYLDLNRDVGIGKRYEVEDENIIFSLFEYLYDPPAGLRSFVPPESLRAAFVLEDAIVVDLSSEKLVGLDFYAERMMLYQILLSIFKTFDVDRVYIIKDGKPAETLVKYVDISLSFGKKEWSSWPIRW